jgi:hypothetical protein
MINRLAVTAIAVVLFVLTLVLSGPGEAAGVIIPPTPQPESSLERAAEVEVTLPDLITLTPSDLRLVRGRADSWRVVRFSNSIANIGEGPLEVIGQAGPELETYQVRQRIFTSDDQVALEPLLTAIEYHPEHGHWHLQTFARYELWSTTADGGLKDLVEVSGKVSYCLMDVDRGRAGSAERRGYQSCGPTKQGISAGWIDTYRSHIPGQFVSLSDLPNGLYALRSVVDPEDHIRESNEDNNEATVFFYLTDWEVNVLEAPPNPWARLRPIGDEAPAN